MTLLDNWKSIATKAWSMWAWGCAAIVMLTEHFLPFAADLLPWWLGLLLATAGMILRLVPQTNIPNTIKPDAPAVPGVPGAVPGVPGVPGAAPGVPGVPGAVPGVAGPVPGVADEPDYGSAV